MKSIAVAVLLLWSSSRSQTNTGLSAELDSAFAGVMHENGPGGSVLILSGGKTIYNKSFGFADLGTKERFSPKTVSNLGSISKTFVGFGILLLRDEGKLSLEDNLLKFFPDFKNRSIAGRITLRHLLTHTSGLPDSRPVDRDSVFYLTANDEQNFAPLKLSDTLEFEPGSRWNYSNPAFNGLALVIEKVSGMKWQKFIQERIFKPAGMTSSVITDGAFPSKGVAHGYRKVDGKYQEYDYGEYPTFCAAGNGGVWSSIDDLVKYCVAMKNAGFIRKESVNFAHTLWTPPNWADSIPPQNGVSWFVSDSDADFHQRHVYHTGHQAGFIAYLDMFPARDLLMIIELNAEEDMDRSVVLRILQRHGIL
jgi:CubicO group peptidase (beta-lactamase class C family)